MAMTAAERRRKERERKRDQRAAARAEGKPTMAMVHAAIVEALAFEMADGVNIGPDGREVRANGRMIDGAIVAKIAGRILRRRHGIARDHSKIAIVNALRARPEHAWPSHYPTRAISPPEAGLPAMDGAGVLQDASRAVH